MEIEEESEMKPESDMEVGEGAEGEGKEAPERRAPSEGPVPLSRSRLEARLDFLQLLKQHSPSLFQLRNGYRNWPSVGGKYLDMYLLFQLVLKNGGRENVIANKLWLRCGKVLHLPKTCTSLSHQLRMNYEKYLTKIEAEYRQKRMRQLHSEGISSNPNVDATDTVFDFGDLVDVYTLQEAGAIAMGYPSRAITPLEMEAFPSFGYEATPEARGNYIDSRNHILLKWVQRVGDELLLFEDILQPLEEAYDTNNTEVKEILDMDLLCKIFSFLEVNGSINVGCFRPRLSPSQKVWLPGELGKRQRKRMQVVVIGAGLAGLACASQLVQFGYNVKLLEARNRVGGRVLTDWSFRNAAVDVGAMLITGEIGHPMTLLCHQLGQKRHVVKSSCPLYKGTQGQRVPQDLDEKMEKVFNRILDLAAKEKHDLHLHIPASQKPSENHNESQVNGQPNHPTSSTAINAPGEAVQSGSTCPPVPFPSGSDPIPEFGSEVPDDATIRAYGDIATRVRSKLESEEIRGVEEEVRRAIETGKAAAKSATVDGRQPSHLKMPEEEKNRREKDRSLQEVLEFILQREYEVGSMTAEDRAVLQWHLANLEYGCATNLLNVSNLEWDQDDEYNWEGNHCLLPNGFGTLVDGLAQPLLSRIHFGANVTRIDYPANKPTATIHYHVDGEAKPSALSCDAVVVTVPLGVLQQNHVEFRPALPSWKLAAMDNLGMGNLNKVILEFPYVFWDPTEDIFGRVVPVDGSDDTFLNASGSPTSGPTDIDSGDATRLFRNIHRGEFYLFWALNRVQNGCPIVIVLMAGDAANRVEEEADPRVVEKLVQVMARFLPPTAVQPMPRPTRAVVSRWRSDPFSRGSYSFIRVGGSGEDYDNLAEPIRDTLFFAGEATSRQHPATTGGAFSSGLREAARIACKYGKLSQRSQPEIASSKEPVSRLSDWRSRMSTLKQQELRRLACEKIREEAKQVDIESCEEDDVLVGPPKKISPKQVTGAEDWQRAKGIGSRRMFDTSRLKECLELNTASHLSALDFS